MEQKQEIAVAEPDAQNLEEQQNPEVLAFFKANPTLEDSLKLSKEEKKNFINSYYTEEPDVDVAISETLKNAEELVKAEIEAGHGKSPFSEALILGLIDIAKMNSVDELIKDVENIYLERRKQVKEKEITDNEVIGITQQFMARMAFVLQQKLANRIENEIKAFGLELDHILPIAIQFMMGDLSFFVDIEKFYNMRKVKASQGAECDLAKLEIYIKESIRISGLILEGKVAQGNLFIFPHMLSDRLFNLTEYESEQVVNYIRKLNESDSLPIELLDLILEEAYAVERSKTECFNKFDDEMKRMEDSYIKERELIEKRKEQEEIFEDKALMKMYGMGLQIPGLPIVQGAGMNIPGMKSKGKRK